MQMRPKTYLPLTDEYKPPKLLHREEQLRKMMKLVYESELPENLWLEGDKGLGKTLTCKFFADEVQARGNNLVLTLRCRRSIRKALENMCRAYGIEVSKKWLSPSAVVRKVLEDRPNIDLLVFIIDEPEEAYRFSEVYHFAHDLYNSLVDARERFGFRWSICFASRILYVKAVRLLEGEKDSRLGLRPVVFPAYNADQIVDIMKLLLDEMFGEGDFYDEEALHYLARHIVRVGSDIREAKRALKYAVEKAEKKITVDVMVDAVKFIKDEWWMEQLARLPPYYALLLYTAAETAQPSGAVYEANQSRVVDVYLKTLEGLNVDRPGLRTIYYALSKLANKGFFIQKQSKSFGNPIILQFDKGDAEHITRTGRQINWKEFF